MSGKDSSDNPWAAKCVRFAANAAAQGRQDNGQHFPLLDPSVLARLEAETGGRSVARAFVSDYIGMWNKRITYLTRTLLSDDAKRAKDAVLSIKNSALMVGAAELAQLAVELERLDNAGDLAAMRASLTQLSHLGEMTVQALRKNYLEQDTGAGSSESS